jgi:KaiC/GvpD/RAD55 family RecA-like ATPase
MTNSEVLIPDEILEFLEKPYGATLLIKGNPGSGKTLLSLELVQLMKGSAFYASIGISHEILYSTYPWIKGRIPGNFIIDVTRESGYQVLSDVDSIVISMKYGDKPSFLRNIISILKDMELPKIIIDSVQAVERVVKSSIVEDLVELSRELDMKTILIGERTDITEVDFLSDGVVELRKEMVDEAILRWMLIHKLRGVEIKQPTYLFTLKNGRFRVFKPFSYKSPEKPELFEPIEDPDAQRFSSGSASLDEIFDGGFRKGTTIILDVGEGVTREMYYRFLQTFALNFLRNGRKVYVIPTLSTEVDRIINETKPFVSESELKNLIFVEKEWAMEHLRDEEALQEAKKAYEIASEVRKGELEELTLVDAEAVHSRYRDAMLTAVEEGEKYIKDTKGLGILITKPGFPLVEEISNFCDIHIKMENVCGVPVIKGLKPKTQYYAMIVDTSRGYPRVQFEKIE